MAPRAVRRFREQPDAASPQPGGHRVHVLDDEHDLARRAWPNRMPGQPLGPPLLVEGEPGRAGAELGVPRVGEPVLQAGDVPVEPHRRGQIGDVEDHVAQLRHEASLPPRRPAAAAAQSCSTTCSTSLSPSDSPLTTDAGSTSGERPRESSGMIVGRGQCDSHADQRHGRRRDSSVHVGFVEADRKCSSKCRHGRHGGRWESSGCRPAAHGVGWHQAGLCTASSRAHAYGRRRARAVSAVVHGHSTLVAIPESRAVRRRCPRPGRARDSGAASAYRLGLHEQLRRAPVLAGRRSLVLRRRRFHRRTAVVGVLGAAAVHAAQRGHAPAGRRRARHRYRSELGKRPRPRHSRLC